MDPRSVARAVAVGRIAFGLAAVAVPRRVVSAWVGDDAARPGATVLARSLGIRDAIIGGIALHTAGHPEVGPRWQAMSALADATDLVAVLAVRRSLPADRVIGTVLVAGAATAGGLLAARGLRTPHAGAPVAPGPVAPGA